MKRPRAFKRPTDLNVFVDALREVLGLAPIGGDRERTTTERFGGRSWPDEAFDGAAQRRRTS